MWHGKWHKSIILNIVQEIFTAYLSPIFVVHKFTLKNGSTPIKLKLDANTSSLDCNSGHLGSLAEHWLLWKEVSFARFHDSPPQVCRRDPRQNWTTNNPPQTIRPHVISKKYILQLATNTFSNLDKYTSVQASRPILANNQKRPIMRAAWRPELNMMSNFWTLWQSLKN